MNLSLRKNLSRIIVLMCAIVVLSFASILLNGTLFFVSTSDQENLSDEYFDGLIVGHPELRRIDQRLVWVTHLSTTQKASLGQLSVAQIRQGQACDIAQDFCVLLAETEQSGINLQYTPAPPAQLPSDLPWFGGFVNPLDGSVYDLLGRPYLYQGSIDALVAIYFD